MASTMSSHFSVELGVAGWAVYCVACATLYVIRRGLVVHKLGVLEVARRHLLMEPEWPPGRRGAVYWLLASLVWAFAFAPAYPIVEPVCALRGLTTLYYYYPKACGAGVILERKQTGQQVLRLDWHRFRVNVGAEGREVLGGRSRHPPSVLISRPHVDLPTMGVKHWPWRQCTGLLLSSHVQEAREARGVAQPRLSGDRMATTSGSLVRLTGKRRTLSKLVSRARHRVYRRLGR